MSNNNVNTQRRHLILGGAALASGSLFRKAEMVDGQMWNVEFDKIEHFKDPGV